MEYHWQEWFTQMSQRTNFRFILLPFEIFRKFFYTRMNQQKPSWFLIFIHGGAKIRDAVTGASFSWSSFIFLLDQENVAIFSWSKSRSQKIVNFSWSRCKISRLGKINYFSLIEFSLMQPAVTVAITIIFRRPHQAVQGMPVHVI